MSPPGRSCHQKDGNSEGWRGRGETGALVRAGGREDGAAAGDGRLEVPPKVNGGPLPVSASLLLHTCPNDWRQGLQHTHAPCSTAHISQRRKQPKHLAAEEWTGSDVSARGILLCHQQGRRTGTRCKVDGRTSKTSC